MKNHIRRREFITLLGGAAMGPVAATAQERAVPVVGFLDTTVAAANTNRVSAFRQGLNEASFVEGRNVVIEFRWAENQLDRLPALAADLVGRRVAAIVTNGSSLSAVKAATSTIPIVLVTGADPVEAGFVASLNRPVGNVTGVSFFAAPVNPKRLELLHELVPKPAVIALLWDPKLPASEAQLGDVETAARALGRQMVIAKAGSESELDAAFVTIIQAGALALFVGHSPFYAASTTGRVGCPPCATCELLAARVHRDSVVSG